MGFWIKGRSYVFFLFYGTTILSIAHRLTTLQNCDEIIVIDKGKIVQRGTFDQLSDTPGIFQDMKNGVLK